MLKLNFNLRHQDIRLVNKGAVVATDSKNYLVANFNFISDDWEYPLTAVFTSDVEKIPYTISVGQSEELEENECFIPWEVLQSSGNVYVSVFCGDLHTTNTVKFKVVKSGYTEGEIPPPPTPTIYEQILQALDNKQPMLTAGENITITEKNVISASSGSNDYTELENKPSINNVTLSGNKSSDDLNLQGKLTAGNNITIEGNVISAEDGVTSYNDLTDKPTVQVNNSQIVPLSGKLRFSSGFSLGNYLPGELIRVDLSDISRSKLENWQNYLYGVSLEDYDLYVHPKYNFNDLSDPLVGTNFTNIGYIRTKGECLTNTPQIFSSNISNNSRVLIIHYNAIPRAEQYHYLLRVIYFQDSSTNKIRQFAQWIYYKSAQDTTVHNVTDWSEIGGSQIVSGVVNVNGTITFTDSEGNSFTTSGESVIGNYTLTEQDKEDIADIVIQKLQGSD